MSAPIKKFSAGGVQVAIWQNETKSGKSFSTVSIDRRYKEKDSENWKSSNSFPVNDLPKAIFALQEAYRFLAISESEKTEKTS